MTSETFIPECCTQSIFFCQLELFLVHVSSGFFFLHCIAFRNIYSSFESYLQSIYNGILKSGRVHVIVRRLYFLYSVQLCFAWPYIHTWKTSFLYLHSEESVCIPDCNRSESSREEKKVPVKEDALTVKKTGNCVSLIVPQQDCQLQDLLKQLRTPAA